MTQPYINVTEFINDHDRLEYDGSYYYDHDLYGILKPSDAKYSINFFGNHEQFNANSPFSIRHLVTLPSSGVKHSDIINDTLVILDNDETLHFYHLNSDVKGEYIDDSYINNTFSDVINEEILTFSVSPNKTMAIFVMSNGEPVFHNVTTPNDINTLINNRTVKSCSVNMAGHFCLVFDNGEVLYYNGDSLSNNSYKQIPQDIITNEDYSSFSTTNKVTPNSIDNASEVMSYNGFAILTYNGNVIVWGDDFNDINNNGSVVKPVKNNNIVSLKGIGEDFGVALQDDGKANIWGVDTGNRLSDIGSKSDIHNIVVAVDTIMYTQENGKEIQLSGSSVNPLFSSNPYFDLNDVIEQSMYLYELPYSDGYFFTVTKHSNANLDDVYMDFKMKKHDDHYYIPAMHYMDYEPAEFEFEVYSKCKSKYNSIGENVEFSVVDSYYNEYGNVDNSKLLITPIDKNQNGIPDNPLAYKLVVGDGDFIILETFIDNDVDYTRISNNTIMISKTPYILNDRIHYADVDKKFVDIDGNEQWYLKGNFYRGESLIDDDINPNRGYLLENDYDQVSGKTFMIKHGRAFSDDDPFRFQWNHYSSDGTERIDPAISSIMDMYVLTNAYDDAVRTWVRTGADISEFPIAPTTEEIRNDVKFVEDHKSTSDQVIYIPAKYKILFGDTARPEHQAEFKIVKMNGTSLTDNEIKTRTINAVNDYFDVDNWDFGETFYFTELAAYIHSQLITHVASVVIVPKFQDSSFGDLFQIMCEPNELFLSTATVNNVVITNQYTNQNIRKRK